MVERLDALLRPAMEKSFWVRAEISSGREKGGSFYCDLVETDEEGHLLAQVRCMIWSKDLKAICQKFQREGLQLQLEDGQRVGILCRVQFHPVYGLSFKGLDMDPSMALGELELKKRKILETLKKESLLELNKQNKCPLLPVKIGLITSEGTAAFYDFIQTLFASGFGFQVVLASASMQGEQTESSILRSFDQLEGTDVDLIVICRGGGSKIDLFWLDNEVIARRIAASSYPIWTGIGHEIDTSILDYVASQSFKTPTAIAEEIVGRFVNMEQYLAQALHNAKSVWGLRLKREKEKIEASVNGIQLGSKKMIRTSSDQLEVRKLKFSTKTKERLYIENSKLQMKKHQLSVGPGNFLKSRFESISKRIQSLKSSYRLRISERNMVLKHQYSKLKIERLRALFLQKRDHLGQLKLRFVRGPLLSHIQKEKQLLASKKSVLKAADPELNLEKGYSLVKNKKGNLITSVRDLEVGLTLTTKMKGGQFSSTVQEIKTSSGSK